MDCRGKPTSFRSDRGLSNIAGCTSLQERVQLVSLCFAQGRSAKPQSTAGRASGVGGQCPVLRSRMASSVTFLNNCSGNVIIFIVAQFWPDKS